MTKEDLKKWRPTENEMNEKLRNLYSGIPEAFPKYVENYNESNDVKITNPYLICVPDAYVNCKTRIMVVGQETFGWFSEGNTNEEHPDQYSAQNTIEELQSLYNQFVNDEKGYYSPIWKFYKQVHKRATENGMGIIANNIAKVGFVSPHTGFDSKAVCFLKFLFKEELRICRPNIIYFMTGPRYDKLIADTMGEFDIVEVFKHEDSFKKNGTRKFAKFNFKDSEYKDILVYRTYHPGYLQRKKRKDWCNHIYKKILSLDLNDWQQSFGEVTTTPNLTIQ